MIGLLPRHRRHHLAAVAAPARVRRAPARSVKAAFAATRRLRSISHKDMFMSRSQHGAAMNDASAGLSETLEALRAAAEETRLRMLALLAEGELSVSDLTDILGQSQPRISRHLKLLVEAGLVERHREGRLGLLPPRTERAASAQILRADPRRPRPAPTTGSPATAPASPSRAGAALVAGAQPSSRAWRRTGTGCARCTPPRTMVEAAILDAVGPKPIRQPARPRHRHRPHAAAARRRARSRAVGLDCQPRHAVRRPRQPREGGPARHRAAPGRHLRAALRARHLRPRHHPPGAALSRRSGPGAPRGGAARGAGRAHPRRRFRAARPRVPARGPGASPARLRARAGRGLARRGRSRLHARRARSRRPKAATTSSPCRSGSARTAASSPIGRWPQSNREVA